MTRQEKAISDNLGKRSIPKGNKGRVTPLSKEAETRRKKQDDAILRMSDRPFKVRDGAGLPSYFDFATVRVTEGLQSIEDYMNSKEYKDIVKESKKKKTSSDVQTSRKTFDYWTAKL